MSFVGIDLGTTNTVVCYQEEGEALIIPNHRGNRLTPSVVSFKKGEGYLVGEAALNQGAVDPDNTIQHFKRDMGTSRRYTLQGRRQSPEEISSILLKKVIEDSEAYLGKEINKAVITVPAYFDESARKATKEAGEKAGLQVLRLISEPTAAAIAYASRSSHDETILVYDLGGGTFDATLLRKQGKEYVVLSNSGFRKLGGIDFDQLLYQKVLKDIRRQWALEVESEPLLKNQLHREVEKAKIELSSRQQVDISMPFMGSQQVMNIQVSLKREDLEELIRPLVGQTIEQVKRILKETGVRPEQVDRLILAGGSTRIPLVQQELASLFVRKGESRINPDEVVALGAGIAAGLEKSDILLRDVTPYSLGVEIAGGQFLPLIKRNTTVPAVNKRTFTTIANFQKAVEIHVMQQDPGQSGTRVSLGRFLLSGIKPGPKGAPKVEVAFHLDSNGILKVSANDLDTKARSSVTIDAWDGQTSSGLTGERKNRSRLKDLVEKGKKEILLYAPSLHKEWSELADKSNEALSKKDDKLVRNCILAIETLLLEAGASRGGMDETF